MITLRHHSRLLSYRNPQGAVPCGTRIHISADLQNAEGAQVYIRLWQEGAAETLIPMQAEAGRVSGEIIAPDHPCLVWYFFVLHTREGQTFYYGAQSGEGMFVMHEPQSYQITVYDGAFTTPGKFQGAVAYQIFPDRFKRSSWEDFRARAQYHTGKGRFLRIHDRWSESPCYTPAPGQACYMPDDFFGGDLNGIREKLPYLESLGIRILYLNPIFESPSNHRYDTADYHRIDPILGTEEEFAALCREAETYGITVMLDGVFSHTGADSRYFDKYSRYETQGAFESKDSPYYPWYSFSRWPNAYDCWWNFPALPNVNELNPGYTAFIAGDQGVLSHWAEKGASSWRLDVADELPDAFIRLLRERIKKNNPDALLMGEVWDDCSNKYGPEGRRGYVNGDELDCAMNYPFTVAVIGFLSGKTDAYALQQTLGMLREHYPKPFYEACFNLISSHDIVRARTALSGAPERTAVNRVQQAGFQPTPAEDAKGKKRLILAAALQMTLPGIPCVYYGDEAGMTGMADPFNRGTYPWGGEDMEIFHPYAALLNARKNTPALQLGLTRMGALSPEVFAVIRYTEDKKSVAVLIINRSERQLSMELRPVNLAEGPDGDTPVTLNRGMTDVLSGTYVVAGEALSFQLAPLSAALYIG